jgi:hypothetical protein
VYRVQLALGINTYGREGSRIAKEEVGLNLLFALELKWLFGVVQSWVRGLDCVSPHCLVTGYRMPREGVCPWARQLSSAKGNSWRSQVAGEYVLCF